MKIKFLGHSCFFIEANGKNIIIDPFVSPNPQAAHLNINDIKVDYILLTHGHEDHIADVENVLKNNPQAMIVSNYEIVVHYAKKGFDKGHPMNVGGSKEFDFGKVKMVNAIHSSSFPDGSYAGVPAGFVIESEGKAIYHAGDTALCEDMKQLASSHQLDLSMLPIGDNFTMGLDDALLASDYIGCDKFVGMHYNTFPPIEIDLEKTKETALKAGKDLVLLGIGEFINL
ncbi:metal-dependent hydrolase [Aureibacter tunicatorum]|uniref:UPF0173 metal-dependent hydrolase HNQ88_002885 n=1 Tax=Aureibacter tunicatorum TaxID=866807 RepID=A0AAE3XMT8_9BACT|nr:metal-dependent hydrolase [Aureibacter tunicatorum]MDR6239837.1 L-ascorbate metabolism protein UlaG (beta-lactamase superfamily) [Aureibacter tunicatorum]BDD04312.1 UPF0173 metal-dependent hydrolase [Aureibacter tunicatorum]